MLYTYIILLVLLNLAAHGVSISCRSCTVPCGEAPSDCMFGTTKDLCGCCDYCASGPGEECGQFRFRCGVGLECAQSFDNALPNVCIDTSQWADLKIGNETFLTFSLGGEPWFLNKNNDYKLWALMCR